MPVNRENCAGKSLRVSLYIKAFHGKGIYAEFIEIASGLI